jgi:hypothetical protein
VANPQPTANRLTRSTHPINQPKEQNMQYLLVMLPVIICGLKSIAEAQSKQTEPHR